MLTRQLRLTALVIALVLAAFFIAGPAAAQEKTKFRIAWTIYVGWMPWDYADKAGIIDKWADKYGIEIEVVQVNDYIESINQFTAGAFDGTVMTNMDALTIPAAGGVDSTGLIVGDFSNGNDGVVLKKGGTLADIKGRNVNLVELSVSHYLLARGLETVGLSERDLTVVNTSDADMVSVAASEDVTALVTWNPLLSEILAMPGTKKVFDSSQIPGEIIDLMVVNTETLEANPKFAKALVGAWYETMMLMAKEDQAALTAMAEAAGTDLAGYKAQLDTTKMFYMAGEAVAFTESPELIETMRNVAEFSFDHGLLGEGAPDASYIGMAFPGGQTWGNQDNVKFRYTSEYMRMAAEGKL